MDISQSAKNDWFRATFDRLYPLLYAHRDDESAAQEAAGLVEILEIGGKRKRILDACCGAGRHAEAFSKARFEVVGFDLSSYLIHEAQSRRALKGRLARADLRQLPYGTVFDVVFNLFTSFGYFLDERDNEQALAEMVRVIVPGGRLVMDHMNRRGIEKNLVAHDTREMDGSTIRQQRRIEGNRIVKEIRVDPAEGGPIELHENVRLYDPEELASLFEKHGLSDIKTFGGFNGEPFTSDSLRMILVGTKF